MCTRVQRKTFPLVGKGRLRQSRKNMRYKTEDLKEVLNKLHGVRAKWRSIGLQLGLDGGDLDAFEHDHKGDAQRCFEAVINAWLVSGHETTSERLAQALSQPTVGESRLAEEIHPNIYKEGEEDIDRSSNCRRNCRVLLHVIAMLYLICLPLTATDIKVGHSKVGHSSSLPDIEEDFIGRDREMQEILQNLNHANVPVVNLYGLPGLGKSTIAIHIGHAMLKQGIDVHYILAEYLQGVDTLEKKLENITETGRGKTLTQWAKSLERKSLLILDNVDGNYWVQDERIRELKKKFINVLQSNSKKIQVLLTSQRKILTLERCWSYSLFALDIENCSLVLQKRAIEANISNSNARTICGLVEGIPFVVKVLAAVLSPPDEYSIAYVIERLSSSSKLTFIAEQGTSVDEDRILGTLELAFKSITKECYKYSLLLVRYIDTFSEDLAEDLAKDIITKEMIRQFADADFHIEECLHKLSSRSLLETRYNNVKTYRFHTIVRSYLKNMKVDNMQLLKMFWIQRCKFSEFAFINYWYNEEDVQMFTGLMQQENDKSSVESSIDNRHIRCIRVYTLTSGSTEAKKLTAKMSFIIVHYPLVEQDYDCHSSNISEYIIGGKLSTIPLTLSTPHESFPDKNILFP